MSTFKPLNVKKYQKTGTVVTPDKIYWKRLSVSTLVKEFGAIDYVDFSPIEPHYFAVTCSVRVQIYNPITKLVVKNLSRFQETAYGGSFRQDGRLLVAGDEQGSVKLFDTATKNVLRSFRGHKSPVHRTFFTADMLHVTSFSDDRTVKLWDIATESAVHTFNEHNDYVRAGAVNPMSTDVIVSGGYDGLVKLYDTRTRKVTFSVDHGCPVESLLFLPTGGIFISAGGTEVRVWDALAGCRLLTILSQHQKTVTCVRLGSNGKRLLSAGLDRHVKIYDVASYQPVHTLEFPNSVLSLGLAQNDQSVVAGMVDGLISIQNMEAELATDAKPSIPREQKYITSDEIDHEVVNKSPPNAHDAHYNILLRKYQYVKCLQSVLHSYVTCKTPEVTVSVMQELIHRKGLYRAVRALTDIWLVRIISFICNSIGEARFMRVLIDVGMTLLDAFEDSFHEFTGEVGNSFLRLATVLEKETKLTYDLLELQGSFELLIEASKISDQSDGLFHFTHNDNQVQLKQSAMALESSILTV